MQKTAWDENGWPVRQKREIDAIFPSLAAKLHFPDYTDPRIPPEAFAEEIIAEFAQQILLEEYDPWWDYGESVLSLARSKSSVKQPELDESTWLPEFMPDKLPYDYAEPIVAGYMRAWAEAERIPAPAQVRENNYNIIMGGLLKRSRLSQQDVMDALVDQGAVDAPGEMSLARSIGKMVEDLVACLKKESLWESPASRNRIDYKEFDYSQFEKAAEYVVSGYAKRDWKGMPSYEHPLETVMETVDGEVSAIANGAYEDMLSWSDWYWEDFTDPSCAMCETVSDRQFALPPRSLLEASMNLFVEKLEAAEPNPQVEKVQDLLRQPFVKEESFFYDCTLDMDGAVWADLLSREVYKAVNDAIDEGNLPGASVDTASIISGIEANITEFGPNAYCWLIYRPAADYVRFTCFQPAVLGMPVNEDELMAGERAMMLTYAEAAEWLKRQATFLEMLL